MANPIDATGLPRTEEVEYPTIPGPDGRLYPTKSITDEEVRKTIPGYFHGPVNAQINHWRQRALLAEARVRELEAELNGKGKGQDGTKDQGTGGKGVADVDARNSAPST